MWAPYLIFFQDFTADLYATHWLEALEIALSEGDFSGNPLGLNGKLRETGPSFSEVPLFKETWSTCFPSRSHLLLSLEGLFVRPCSHVRDTGVADVALFLIVPGFGPGLREVKGEPSILG